MSPDLEKLIALQDIDLKIQQLRSRLATIPEERQRIEERFNEYSSAYNDLREQLETARSERRRIDQELEETQRHHEKYKEDLMKVRNEKEYTTCLREIDVAKKTISQLETEALERMEQIEKLEAELSQFTPEIENRRRTVDEELAACDKELATGQQGIDEVVAERDKISTDMPKALIARYERVARLRNGIALAEATNSSCSECRMRIRPQAYSEIRRGEEIIVCENCSRILYYRAETPESATASD